ncbi:unnamed protein product [Rotaria sordida]|uniref:MARVEL domain-containing protein n=1 Tax=Rotaria sordida TaxID=392033 RepID=A0A813XD59_9BILA|nr:unnamed protein product [Rotaria sordida]
MATNNNVQSANHATSSTESESRIDTAYLISIRGILKYACLLFCFTAFICVVSTPQCSGTHLFLAVVTFLVMIIQIIIIIIFVFRLKTKFPGIDFELLIASSVLIHYCRISGQLAGGAMGLIAFLFLVSDAVIIFLAQRKETVSDTNNQDGR